MPVQATGRRLQARRIAVARPPDQAAALCAVLRHEGAETVVCPGIEIAPCAESADTRQSLDSLAAADWAVFVSTNAVEHGLAAVERHGGWPAGLRTAAVGAATARALEAAGLGPVLRPLDSDDSEGLLAAPGWGSLAQRRVVIFRGVGGRETLARGLRAAGAEVDYAEVYQRLAPGGDPAPLQSLLQTGGIDAICVMSAESLHRLFDWLGAASHPVLRATPWLVPHPRIAAAARAAGITTVLESRGADDGAVLETLLMHFAARQP